jgi:hypothetical protein
MVNEGTAGKVELQGMIDIFQATLNGMEYQDQTAFDKQWIEDQLSKLRQQMFDTYGVGS